MVSAIFCEFASVGVRVEKRCVEEGICQGRKGTEERCPRPSGRFLKCAATKYESV